MHSETLRCGLLGRTLSHSYSPAIHAQLAGYSYLLYEKEPEELEGFLRSGEFDGLNVTIPYKKTVIPYCAELSDTARAIGAVNTIVRRPDGTLWGGNTDAYGFSMLVQSSGAEVRGKKALVFGSGGASATAQYVLRQMGAREVVVISRHGEDNYENLDRHTDAEIAVNATPLGMYPNTGVSPSALSRFPALEAALDMVYNPARTEFLLQAEQLGLKRANGLLMLTAQAKKSCEAFLGAPIADERIAAITKSLAAQMQNVVLIGMPGSGKTTIGTRLAAQLGVAGHIRYTGPLDASAMRQAYLEADVFLLPSSCENSPNSLGEAMLLGLPCVAAAVGWIPSMLEDGREGYLYGDALDEKALANAILRVLQSPDGGTAMGQAARARALQTHDAARNADDLIHIYETILREEHK